MELIKPVVDNANKSCVYRMTINNSSYYIGSTSNLVRRICQYKYALKKKLVNTKVEHLLADVSLVEFTIVEIVKDRQLLKHREDVYIKKNWGNPELLNRSPSAFGNKGLKLSQEQIAAISIAVKGLKHTPEQNEKKSIRQTGKKMSPAARDKISKARKGIKFSDEHRQKLSEARMGRKPSALSIKNSCAATRKKVQKLDMQGNLIETYNSYTDAASSVGSMANHVSMVVNGHRKSLKGFVFRSIQPDASATSNS